MSQDKSGTPTILDYLGMATSFTSEAWLKEWFLANNSALRRQSLSCPPEVYREMQRDLRDFCTILLGGAISAICPTVRHEHSRSWFVRNFWFCCLSPCRVSGLYRGFSGVILGGLRQRPPGQWPKGRSWLGSPCTEPGPQRRRSDKINLSKTDKLCQGSNQRFPATLVAALPTKLWLLINYDVLIVY